MTATTTDPRAKLPDTPLSGNEALKERSDYLHGTIKEELKDDFTGGFTADNFQLIRFHAAVYPAASSHRRSGWA